MCSVPGITYVYVPDVQLCVNKMNLLGNEEEVVKCYVGSDFNHRAKLSILSQESGMYVLHGDFP